MLLGGDIGGTKTLLALAEREPDGRIRIVIERSYPSRDYARFEGLLKAFEQEAQANGLLEPIEAAAIGVAGPVDSGRAKVTYLPWELDAAELSRHTSGASFLLLNDFAAAAAGLLELAAVPTEVLHAAATTARGTRVILGAGTGLGVAALISAGEQWKIVPGEGGHAGFAPADQEQMRLREWLAERDPRVTVERILSGRGLVDLYRFVCERCGGAADVDISVIGVDHAAAIASHGLVSPESSSGRALRLFCSVYGAFAGDLALLFNARGGVFLAGGIAPKIINALRGTPFLSAFRDKGVHSTLVANYAAQVIMEPRLGLLGALQLAAGYAVVEN